VRTDIVAYYVTWCRSKLGRETGQGLVEYALVILFVALALIVAVGSVAAPLSAVFSRAQSALVAG